jgi:hypothetical protein
LGVAEELGSEGKNQLLTRVRLQYRTRKFNKPQEQGDHHNKEGGEDEHSNVRTRNGRRQRVEEAWEGVGANGAVDGYLERERDEQRKQAQQQAEQQESADVGPVGSHLAKQPLEKGEGVV